MKETPHVVSEPTAEEIDHKIYVENASAVPWQAKAERYLDKFDQQNEDAAFMAAWASLAPTGPDRWEVLRDFHRSLRKGD